MSVSMRIKAYILRRFTRKKSIDFDIRKAKNILFLRYDRIGDMVITTPVFRELKLAYPEINITVLASKANQCVLLNNPYVDLVITNHKNNLLKDLPTLLVLRKEKFDVCVEFDHSVIPHAILRLRIIKPRKIISVIKEGRYGVKGDELKLYDYFTEKPKDTHFRDIWLNTLNPFGVTPKSKQYDLFCSDQQKGNAVDFLSQFQKKIIIGINLEGAVKGKKITSDKLEEICRGIFHINREVQIILLSSPKLYSNIVRISQKMNLPYVVPSYKTVSVLDVAALIQNLQLIITPDTSIVHIASAFNIPIVSIHEKNNQSYHLFKPKSQNSRTVFSEFSDRLDGYNIDNIIRDSMDLLKINES
jgi:ADP-heptose:LPS heptosyltransferase